MRKKRVFEKVFKLSLITAMLISNFSNGLFMTAEAEAGPNDGQVEYVGGKNSTPAGNTYEIHASKTIEAVEGKENYFDITLQTRTKRYRVDTSTDVVIVLDISNTMNSDADGNNTTDTMKTKLYQAKAATNKFIGEYASNTKLDPNRKVAVVTFNSDASVAVPLTEANDWNDFDDPHSENDIYAKVNAISAPGIDSDRRFTNIEGGLQLAKNILDNQSTARFKFIILLTDGFPTTYIESNKTSTTSITGYNTMMGLPHTNYNETKANSAVDGYFANTRAKVQCGGGTSYSNKAALKAQSVAQSIKASGINIFSVGIALKSQDITQMATYIVDTTGMTANQAYAIGNNTESYKAWLRDSIAGGNLLTENDHKYADGASQSELEAGYRAIMEDIEKVPDATMREFYTVDPMSDVVDFISFFDKDGNLATTPTSLTGQSKQGAENTATYTSNNQTINWNMLESGYTMDGDYLVFTLKYRIRLKNEASSFAWSTAYDANKTTTLNYSQKYVESGEDVPNGTGTLNYPIPEIEGYCGKLMFKKVDKLTQNPIKDVEFILHHNGEDCSVCEGDATIADVKVSSDANGMVSFTNIPSGHEYSLLEGESARFAPIASHSVTVSYGKTYVDGTDDAHLLEDGKFKDGKEFVIENVETKPIQLKVQAIKKQDGTAPAAGTYRFTLSGTAPSGTVNETVSNDAQGLVTFSTLTFNEPGTYNLKVTEEVGTNTNIIYDKTEHTLTVNSAKDTAGLNYILTVSIDGGTAQTYNAKENALVTISAGEFNNTTRAKASVSLTATKTLVDRTLKTNEFSFVLKDNQGNVLQTKKNSLDGTITFDTLEFSTVGEYHYTISEVAGNDDQTVYDSTVYDVVVHVTAPSDLTSTSALQAETVVTKSGDKVTSISFENSQRKPASLTINAKKWMNGIIPAKDAYTFELVQINPSNQSETVIEQVKNDASGNIQFTKLVYDSLSGKQSENFVYHLREVKGTDTSVTYDDSYYLIRVYASATQGDSYTLVAYLSKVKDGESTYLTEVSGTNLSVGNSTECTFEFNNSSSVKFNLSALKKMNGKALEQGQQFKFAYSENGQEVEEVTNKQNGTIQFTAITYGIDDIGKHTYTVYEKAGTDLTIAYDNTIYTVEVNVSTDGKGNLSISDPVYKVKNTPVESIIFDNLKIEPIRLSLSATKSVNDATPTQDQVFSFDLINEDGTVLQTKTNSGSVITFDDLIYEYPGTYTYTVKEKTGSVAGITGYDSTIYTVQVEVFIKEGTKNVLDKKVTISDGSKTVNTIHFNNVYEATPVEVNLKAKKTLTGKTLEADMFNFVLALDGKEIIQSKSNDASGVISFEPLKYYEEGNYTYTVYEVDEKAGGMTYDTTVYTVSVVVKDDQKGALKATVTVNQKTYTDTIMEFKNEYNPSPTSIIFEATKTLEGRTLKADEFEFELKNADGTERQVKKNKADGSIAFDSITYSAAGTYNYIITEKQGSLGGITYDSSVKSVTVVVVDDGNGNLSATVDNQVKTRVNVGQFNNIYKPAKAELNVTATKNLTGSKTLEAGAFSFVLKDANQQIIQTKTNLSDGSIQFDKLDFNEVGTYQYTVSEVSGNLEGVTYDTTVKNITVVVEDNGVGNLICKVNNQAVTTISAGTFTNNYEASPTQIELTALKELIGRDLVANEFTFQLLDEEDTVIAETRNDQDGNVIFDSIEFETVGEYIYKVKEKSGNLGGVTYSDTVLSVKVVVTDSGDGKLEATVNNEEQESYFMGTITNTYLAKPAKVTLTANKVYKEFGDKKALSGQEYTFYLKDKDNNIIQTVKNDASGLVRFADLQFAEVGTYQYTITEKDGGTTLSGVTYSSVSYPIQIVVKDDGLGQLYTIINDTNTLSYNAGEFVNEYNTEKASVTLGGVKYLEGRDLKNEEFSFVLKEAGDVLKTVKNDTNGVISFEKLEYTQPGSHTYTISEVKESLGGVSYDETIYTVLVTVEDNRDGTLSTDVQIKTETGTQSYDSSLIVFNNTYEAEPVKVTLQATKVLTGRALENQEFEFELKNQTGEVVSTAKNTGENVVFDELTFDTVGEYKYTVSEKQGTLSGVTYDQTVYEVTITVTDDEEGHLEAEVNVKDAPQNSMVFNNQYHANVVIKALKKLEGRALKEDEFTFVLLNEDGSLVQTKKNKADGTITFDEMQFTDEGVYTYTISEVKENLASVRYDETVYTVVVTVTKDQQGYYSTNVLVNGVNYDPTLEIVFKNVYKPNPASVTISGTKIFLDTKDNPKTLKGNEFTFYLKDQGGLVIQEVKNAADGSFSFNSIAYNRVGTYHYTVTEKVGKGNIHYDRSVYNVTVKVVDDGYGNTKVAEVIKTKGSQTVEKIEFVNKISVVNTSDPSQSLRWSTQMTLSGLLLVVVAYLKRRLNRCH